MTNSVKNVKKRGKPFEPGNPGRPKGTPNKFTQLKGAFIEAFEEIGGKDGLSAWAKQSRNRAEFYRLISKLFPKEVELSGTDSGPIDHKVIVEFVGGNNARNQSSNP